MRLALIVLCALGQLAVLGYMAGAREWLLRHGETVFLRTAPVDPRDVFRGDYVRLEYDATWIPASKWRGAVTAAEAKRGGKVYAVLTRPPGGISEVAYLADTPPADGLYIRGRLTDFYLGSTAERGALRVSYGVEQLFVQQGRGLEIEARRGSRDDLQVPMEVRLAVGGDGEAAIKGYGWSPLGIRLEVLRRPASRGPDGKPTDPAAPLSPLVRLTLVNVSLSPLVVVDPGPHCAVRLVPAEPWARQDYEAVSRGCENVLPSFEVGGGVRILREGESHAMEIDLSQPQWHVRLGEKAGEIGEIAKGWDRFRLVFRSPPEEKLALVPMAIPVWRGTLSSAAFNATGIVD